MHQRKSLHLLSLRRILIPTYSLRQRTSNVISQHLELGLEEIPWALQAYCPDKKSHSPLWVAVQANTVLHSVPYCESARKEIHISALWHCLDFSFWPLHLNLRLYLSGCQASTATATHFTLSKQDFNNISYLANRHVLKLKVGTQRKDLSLLGVPIAYDNIKVVGELGDIYDDQGHIHLNIEADFVIFCPEPGQKLVGTINKVSSSHIGCLVHGCFNASIPKPEQMPAEQWQTLEINVGDELEFEVFRLDSDAAGVFCIRGKLNSTSLQTKCSTVSEEVTETGIEEAVEKPPKKKKKKKRDPEPYEVEGGTTELADVTMKEETDLQINNSVNGLWEEEPKKKKKKKKHQEDQDQDPVFQGSDSSGYQSDHKKKKKKRKHSEETEFTLLLEHAPKKKREK
ncbi:DNA-directed RNA polymerase I subunit RPA43 isoform X1 [Hippopotamus amphibius kiboko]|uniref:DNA-directed RNA polymerase I subunit RPA43 isoform X1 n=1 Tax=Hippopotamus amphibius kiboko TaxID=575201 RepID=UPI00259244FB|nr:DNA-directed RNA polymerase I subunit RPA43 isoform X1 [Hippopotamus amphibius kiboko]